jgi:hypothetical protein
MANRLFTQFRYTLEKKIVDIYGKATIAATGAPTLVATKSKGVSSIARTGTGAYTITLQDTYVDLLLAGFHIELASGAPAVYAWKVVSYDSTGAKTYLIQFYNDAATAADIADGATLKFKFELKDSGV